MAEEAMSEGAGFGFAVVVRGAMNPALHHPIWYKMIDALSEDEVHEALTKEFVFIPQVAQFRTSSLELFCDTQRWQLATPDLATVDRVQHIAAVVFDKRLAETPVAAIGLNFNFHRQTSLPNVGHYLAQQLAELPLLPLGFSRDEHSIAKISYTWPFEGSQLTVQVEPSVRGQRLVYLGFNAHLHLPDEAKKEPYKFSLGSFIEQKFHELKPVVDAQLKLALEAMRKRGEVSDGLS